MYLPFECFGFLTNENYMQKIIKKQNRGIASVLFHATNKCFLPENHLGGVWE